jgi:hypothetical protein
MCVDFGVIVSVRVHVYLGVYATETCTVFYNSIQFVAV